MTYTITIVDLITGTTQNLKRDTETINQTVERELGGYDNLHAATISGVGLGNGYTSAGTTKDGSKVYSILAY